MNDLTLLHAERWWALLLVPVLVVLLVWDRRRRARRREAYADPRVAPLVFERVPRPGTLRAVSLVLGTALLLFSLMEPSWGRLPLPVSKRAADIVFCLDLSRSMRTKDIPGGREKRARLDLLSILDKLGGNRVALVGFAKSARIFCPLTHDAKAFRFLLKRAKEDEVEQGPTDLGAALRASLTLLPEAEGAYQAVVLLSDGEDLTKSVDQVVPVLAKRGVPLHCIGYGTVKGGPIPDASGMDVLRDEKGKPIISRMDVETLRRLADRTGGVFLSAKDNPLPLVELWNKRILAMQTRETEKGMRTIPISRFQWFLLPGFLLLAFGLRPRGSKNGHGGPGRKRAGLRTRAAAAILPLVFFQGGELRKGVELLRKGETAKAFEILEKAQKKGTVKDPTLLLDHAIAAFRAGKTEEAIASAEKLVARAEGFRPERDLIVGAARLEEALEAFAKKDLQGAEDKVRRALQSLEDAVVAHPDWREGRENLERALRLLQKIRDIKKKQKQQNKKKNDKNKQKNQKNKQNKKNQQNKQDKQNKKEQPSKQKNDQKNDKKNDKQKQKNKGDRKQEKKDRQGSQKKTKNEKQPSPKNNQKNKEKPDQREVPKAQKQSRKKDKERSKSPPKPKDKGKKKNANMPKAEKREKPQKQKPSKPQKPSQAIPMRLSPEERAQLEKRLQRLLIEAAKNRKPNPSRHIPGKKDW